MSEKPILFKSEMVRAVLDGRKTQTRRVVKPRVSVPCEFDRWADDGDAILVGPIAQNCDIFIFRKPPYKVGDVLWVRETFCIESGVDDMLPAIRPDRPHLDINYDEDGNGYPDRLIPHYRATDPEPELCYEDDRPGCKRCEDGEPCCHWRPSIHMPRWAARLFLEVTAVRVERLQTITTDGARAEGVESDDYLEREEAALVCAPVGMHTILPTPRGEFERLWDTLAKPGLKWADNPWVWVIEFRKVQR